LADALSRIGGLASILMISILAIFGFYFRKRFYKAESYRIKEALGIEEDVPQIEKELNQAVSYLGIFKTKRAIG
jgi:hypothetical protein